MQSSYNMILDFDIQKQSVKTDSFRVAKLYGMFDLNDEHLKLNIKGQLQLPDKWNVGAIVGRSGTGKTTIAKKLWNIFSASYTDKPIIDEMPENKTVEEITKIFTNVGFSSPPRWLNKYRDLSNGEKMRVDLAQALLSEQKIIVFDEFTSVVDRDVAKITSIVVSKNVRKYDKQFVAVSCHYDILDYLEPDWVFNVDEMKMIDVKKKNQSQSTYTNLTEMNGMLLASIII